MSIYSCSLVSLGYWFLNSMQILKLVDAQVQQLAFPICSSTFAGSINLGYVLLCVFIEKKYVYKQIPAVQTLVQGSMTIRGKRIGPIDGLFFQNRIMEIASLFQECFSLKNQLQSLNINSLLLWSLPDLSLYFVYCYPRLISSHFSVDM